jgi:hypothetical protein
MSEYLPPCYAGLCDVLSDNPSESTKMLCKGMADCVIGAGGADLLETSKCPMTALMKVGPEDQADPRMAKIRENLGITGFYMGNPLD